MKRLGEATDVHGLPSQLLDETADHLLGGRVLVDRGGPAARAGIAPGDLVIGVNGRDVRAVADLYDPPPTPGGGPATLRLMRGQEPIDVRIPPDHREGLPG